MAETNGVRVYVGNLPFSVGFEELKELFSRYGEVTDSTVVVDFHTGRSRGFGFVTFAKSENADKAIKELDGHDMKGRKLKVNVAKPDNDSSKDSGASDEKEEPKEAKEKPEESPSEEKKE